MLILLLTKMATGMLFRPLIILCLVIGIKSFDNTEQCHCILPHLCGDDDVDANGQGLFDIRIDTKKCPNKYDVCCETPLNDNNISPAASPPMASPQICGYQNLSSAVADVRITSNQKTKFGELPWTVIVLLRDVGKTDRNIFQCGGSLIHPQVVLTAAHCVFQLNPDYISIRAGEWNKLKYDEPLPHQDRFLADVAVHPRYDFKSLKNDIALLFLSEPVTLAANVGIICLPTAGFTMNEKLCMVGGWGKKTFQNGKYSSVMKKVHLPLVERQKCLEALRRTRLGSFFRLHKSFICAGGVKNKDTCKGDGGSPLVCPIPGQTDRFMQMGIVSWGIGCGLSEIPGVYVNVQLFSTWIDEEMLRKNLNYTLLHKY